MLLRLRHRFKQPEIGVATTVCGPITDGVAMAIRAEGLAADGLLALRPDARRVNVHFTQVRTNNKTDVQPAKLTRKQFWEHLCRCFRDAYPRADSPTGSILLFGCVCKELHKDAPRQEDRSEHHHTATQASEKYYWSKIRKISAETYNIQLNAVAHDTYTTMFCYLRCASAKKPVHELDATPFFSAGHPQGDGLKELLALGEKYKKVRAEKAGKDDPSLPVPVRSHFGIAYNWVTQHNIRKRKAVKQLEADAVLELTAGRPQLLDFCKKHKSTLADQIEYIWELHDAKNTLHRLDKTRLDLLLTAAAFDVGPDTIKERCANGKGVCSDMYNSILSVQQVDPVRFCHELFETLQHGRRKGNAFMVVGSRDTGKTTITQPLGLIYDCMDCPQSDSFCPLEGIRGHELINWQDFRYNPGHPDKDQRGLKLDEGTWNRWLEGLPVRVGVPKTDGSRADFVYDEDTPIICTGPFLPTAYRNGYADKVETDQLLCRMKFHQFLHPAPERVDRSFKACPLCWSRWLLISELQWHESRGLPLSSFLHQVQGAVHASYDLRSAAAASAAPQQALETRSVGCTENGAQDADVFARLSVLIGWQRDGLLSDQEFKHAKASLGL